jgi:hypothetical protein
MTRSAMNDAIRRAAGREPAPELEREHERPDGSIGVGQGATCAPPRPRPASSANASARIRAGARLARTFTVPGGVSVDVGDLDDLLGR